MKPDPRLMEYARKCGYVRPNTVMSTREDIREKLDFHADLHQGQGDTCQHCKPEYDLCNRQPGEQHVQS